MVKRLLTILMSLSLYAACTMPETKIYSLSLPAVQEIPAVRTDASINVLVQAPRYLSQSYIAYRTSPYQLQMSRYSRWDSAPDDIVRDAFRDSLSSLEVFREVKASPATPQGSYGLEINLKRFERFDEGEASYGELVFDINLISPEGKELYHGTVTKSRKLEDRSFLSLAKALSAALSEGINEVKGKLVEHTKAGK
jgi:uncharacterized lipoprotein YmbA